MVTESLETRDVGVFEDLDLEIVELGMIGNTNKDISYFAPGQTGVDLKISVYRNMVKYKYRI